MNTVKKGAPWVFAAFTCLMLLISFPAYAMDLKVEIREATNGVLSGYVRNNQNWDATLSGTVLIQNAENGETIAEVSFQADQFSQEYSDRYGDGWHYFESKVDQTLLADKALQYELRTGDTSVTMKGTSGGPGVLTDGTVRINPENSSAPEAEQVADTAQPEENQTAETAVSTDGDTFTMDGITYRKGEYKGNFRLSGYDNNSCCNGRYAGSATYSGKMPRTNHTVAADLGVLPLNTVIIIEGTKGKTVHNYDGIYQVEDRGSGVNGSHLDIYCSTHKEAAAVTDPGWQYSDVWLAVPVE